MSVVQVLSEQLDGGLRPKLLQGRHVQVVHKDHTLLPHGRPEHPLPPLVQPRHDDALEEESIFYFIFYFFITL